MKSKLIILISLFTLVLACKKVEENKVTETQTMKYSSDGEIVLSEPLENPYTIDAMNKALKSYENDNNTNTGIKIETTNLYVRFLPKDKDEYESLLEIENLELFDYPLDRKIVQEGNYYHDDEISEDNITWQYAVVNPNFEFTNVKYEILSELFLPSTYRKGKNENIKNTLASIEEIALRNTNNFEDNSSINEDGNSGKTSTSWYNPSATITVDNPTSDKVQGVRIRTVHWFHVETANTDQNGYAYISSQYKYKVRYSIIWRTNLFRISDGITSSVLIGPYTNSSHWNCFVIENPAVTNPDRDIKRAMSFLAAYDFIHKTSVRGPITQPHRIVQTNIVVKDVNMASHAAFGALNTVFVSVGSLSLQRVYTTTIHELAHMSHAFGAPSRYDLLVLRYPWAAFKSNRAMMESWAEGVEWYIAGQKYSAIDHNQEIRSIHFVDTDDGLTKVREYTQIVKDLIDDHNEGLLTYNPEDANGNIISLPINSTWEVVNNKIYYTPVSFSNIRPTHLQMCPIPGSTYSTSERLCFVDDIPNDIHLYYEITSNQRVFTFYTWDQNLDRPYDRVSGYTIGQIQTALYQSDDWHEWKTNLFNMYPNNPTKNHLNELFNNWYLIND